MAFQGLTSGLNSATNDSLPLQQLLLTQQLQSDHDHEADRRHFHVVAADDILNQANGPPPSVPIPMGNSLHAQEMKPCLLNAVNSLDGIYQQQQDPPPVPMGNSVHAKWLLRNTTNCLDNIDQ